MRSLTLVSIILLATAVFSMPARASVLEDLNKVVKEYGTEIKKEKPDYAPINIHASDAINAISKMTAEEADAVVKLLQFDEAVDPGRIVFDNTFTVLQKNKAALDAALKKLPKREAADLNSHIRLAIEGNTKGQDQ